GAKFHRPVMLIFPIRGTIKEKSRISQFILTFQPAPLIIHKKIEKQHTMTEPRIDYSMENPMKASDRV
ncbi:hypothetical protein, partial [Sporosarcina luteola]|uniref:hypothetical protein n=1 Tax=Sporosarcina luteola TaxID=582850 RepID=UPI001C3FF1D2